MRGSTALNSKLSNLWVQVSSSFSIKEFKEANIANVIKKPNKLWVANQPKVLPQVIIIGDFPFPYGAAAANNLRGHCVALQTAGYTVGVLPKMGNRTKGNSLENKFRGVSYWEITDKIRSSPISQIFRETLTLNDLRLDWLNHADLSEVKAVFAYPGLTGASAFLYRLRKICRKRGIKLFCYVVEWFDFRHLKGTQAWLNILDSELLRRVIVPTTDGALTISEYIQNYYIRKGLRSYCVPPLLDLGDPIWRESASQPCPPKPKSIGLLFSGNYIRDRHDIILQAVLKVRSEGCDIIMQYLGSTREQIQHLPGVTSDLIDALGIGIHFYGQVQDKLVPSIISAASFGIILRDNQRWSQACFPSKVPEFFAFGVPMICNVSSDLARVLRDDENALICHGVAVDHLCVALRRAWKMTDNEYCSMKTSARRTAESFDSRKFAPTYQKLVE